MNMRSLLFVALAVLLLPGFASAQIFNNVEFATTTPFTAGNATVPPGKYIIRLTDDPSMLEIANPQGSISVMVEVSETRTPARRTTVTFNKYGDRLVLKSVQVEGQETGALSSTEMVERRHMQRYGKPAKVEIPGTVIKDETRSQ
jgi:hypothetical protein